MRRRDTNVFPSDQWVMTNFGPVQIKSLLDRPHIAVTHEGNEETNLAGYSLRGIDSHLTICAQGHRLKVGSEHPVYLNDRLALPADKIQRGYEVHVYPMSGKDWLGSGGTVDEGVILGDMIAKFGHRPDHDNYEATDFLIHKHKVNPLHEVWQDLLSYWFDLNKIETLSSDFYKGFLQSLVLDQVKFDSVYYVDNQDDFFDSVQVVRMLMRLGVFTYTTNETARDDRIVIPSYSLRQLILKVGFGEQGAELLAQVEGVTVPQSYTVQVDNVNKSQSVHLYGTRGVMAGTVTEVNSFLVATDGR